MTAWGWVAGGGVVEAAGGVAGWGRLGGLAGPLRWTALGFAIGALALAGIPPFAGFFSKDLILEHAYAAAQHGGSLALWLAGLLTAYVTAVYITRAAVLTFFPPAGRRDDHPHEAPASMGWPMAILALLSLRGGWGGAHAAGAPLLRVLDRFFAIEPSAETVPGAPLTAISVATGVFGIITGLLL